MPSPAGTLLSPRLKTLAAELQHHPVQHTATMEAFWADIAREGSPLIECIERDANRGLVTFLWRATEPLESVRVSDQFSWRSAAERELQPLGDTDLWYLSWWVNLNIRGSYGFTVQPVGTTITHAGHHPPALPDPLNHHNQYTDWIIDETESLLDMPHAEPLPVVPPRGTPIQGNLHADRFTSAILENERPVWVYTPPNHSSDGEPYPFIVIFDGEPFHSGIRQLDAMMTSGEIAPMVAILVNQIGIRNQELTCNPEFSAAIATELVPWARERWHLTTDPAQAALTGRSFGGLCSGYTALKHPDIFGNAFMQSASCWYHPTVMAAYANPGSGKAEPAGVPAEIPSLIQEYMQAPAVPVRIYQQCGSVENGPPPARIWQTFGNRWLHDILALKGYDTTYVEFAGGHDDIWWRPTFPDGIRWMFGPASTGNGTLIAGEAG